jgi:hypothetical protein
MSAATKPSSAAHASHSYSDKPSRARIKGRRRRVALDDKVALSPCVAALEDIEQFRIHEDITFRIVRLRTIELGRLNAYHAFIPAERGPRQHIDFVPPQACQRSKEEDLVLFGMLR